MKNAVFHQCAPYLIAIINFPRPRSKLEMRAAFGVVRLGYLQQVIPRKRRKIVWTSSLVAVDDFIRRVLSPASFPQSQSLVVFALEAQNFLTAIFRR